MSISIVRPSLIVRPATDSRPPARTWEPDVDPTPAWQPMLDLELSDAGSDVRSHLAGGEWMATPSPEMPDPEAWCISLARLLIEALQGLRPIGQLNRWVDEQVLAAITLYQRQQAARSAGQRPARPAVLQSVHVQFPTPRAVEAAAHLRIGERSIALAFRLQEFFGRWLCTAVEIGPRIPASVG
jgi:hypothetical protein